MSDGACASPLTLRYLLVGGFSNETFCCDWRRSCAGAAVYRHDGGGRSDLPSEDVLRRDLRAGDVRSGDLPRQDVPSQDLPSQDVLPGRDV